MEPDIAQDPKFRVPDVEAGDLRGHPDQLSHVKMKNPRPEWGCDMSEDTEL